MNRLTVEDCRRRLRHGLIPAVPVPFNAAGEIDSAAQERYVAHMARQPIAGVAVWAHTGRGLRLSRERRRQVLEAWRKGLDAKQLIVAGVGGSPGESHDFSDYTDSAVKMAQDAIEGGAQALLVHPPRVFHRVKNSDELVLDYHCELASLGTPLILFYLYEAAGGIAYSPDLLRRLFALPQVLGIKLATLDSVMTFQDIARLLADEFREVLLVTGEDRFLGYSLMCGAQAALIGMGAVCTILQHKLMEAYFDGRGAEFLKLSLSVDRLSQALFVSPMEAYIRRVLWALAHLGVIGRESANDPWGPEIPESEFAAIGKTLRALGEL